MIYTTFIAQLGGFNILHVQFNDTNYHAVNIYPIIERLQLIVQQKILPCWSFLFGPTLPSQLKHMISCVFLK